MSTPLDVLLIESHLGAGDDSSAALTASGHRVHRCHHAGDESWACVGVSAPTACPVEGHLDAAVLAREPGALASTPLEDGVRCAIRSGVPVVGVNVTDDSDYAPWVTLRAGDRSIVAACRAAVELARQPLADEVISRISPLVVDAGLDPSDLRCKISSQGRSMTVAVTLPGPADLRLEQAVGVRAYDVLRTHAARYSTVDVTVDRSLDDHEVLVELARSR